MFEVEVSSRGLELSVASEEFPVEVAGKFIERLAEETEATMFFEAPWRSGELAQSITRQVEGMSATIGPLVPYAMYVEIGTAPHEIRPIHTSVLAFKSADGKLVFSSLVNHPGTKANPFMHRTAEQIKRKAPEIFTSIWQSYAGEEQQ